MDDTPAKGGPEEGLNKIDLSQLQDFHFGTQWTEVKSSPEPRRDRERDRGSRYDGPGRGEGRPRDGGEGGEMRRDRRSFRRQSPRPGGGMPPEQSERRGGEEPPRSAEGPRGGRPAEREGGERRWSGSRPPMEPRPYLSPYFNVVFYPEDAGFSALVKAMRGSCRTFELFEIARLILGKPDRFVVVVTRRAPEAPAPAAGAPAETQEPRPQAPLCLTLPDGLPFDSEEAAFAYMAEKHLDRYFDQAIVEVEPPKGNFPFVNRCTLSGELLGPPNYHRYQQIVQQHHAAHFSRMPFDRYRERIETVRDPEVVNQWLEKMKKTTRYTWKLGAEGEAPVVFDSIEEARAYLASKAKDKVVKTVESARFHGKLIEMLPPGEIRRAIDGHVERQRRFPLDTANALRGRLRREGFTIFKKGSKGISYVCAVKRKFRVPGQTFADSIGALIAFIEAHPMIQLKDLPLQLLGFAPPPPPPPVSLEAATTAPAPAEAPAVPSEGTLSPEQQEKLKRLTMDLRWLVREGYVTEFADGRLFTPPPMAEARVKAAESADGEEHDLENFPEVSPAESTVPAEPAPAVTAEPAPADPSAPPAEPPPAAAKPVAPAPTPEPPAEAPADNPPAPQV